MLEEIIGKKAYGEHIATRTGDVKHSQADISAAEEYLGYRPIVTFVDGLKHTVNWYQQNLAS